MQRKRREQRLDDAATERGTRPAAEDGQESPADGGLYLKSLGRSVCAADALDQPNVGLLVSEDFCWRVGYEAWSSSRPGIWRRARRRRWRAEGERLRAKQERIRALAVEVGVGPCR